VGLAIARVTQPNLVVVVVFSRYGCLMTGSATFELSGRDQKRLAASLAQPANARPLAVRTVNGEIALPPAAQRAVRQLLGELAAGNSIHLLADERDLTTQEAADLLGLSRTFVVRLIDDGVIPAHYAGTHRRVRTVDVLDYLHRRKERLDAVAAIAHAEVVIGIPYR
jgi:excisionase family DNA binding protein